MVWDLIAVPGVLEVMLVLHCAAGCPWMTLRSLLALGVGHVLSLGACSQM